MSFNLWRRLCHGERRVKNRADWPEYVGADWPEHIMDVDVTDDFHAKQGRSTGRWVLKARGQRLSVYLKRHYKLPRWHGVLATLWPGRGWSPALQEARHLDWAKRRGFPVPNVVAAGETIGPWGRLQSFLAVEELAGMLPLHKAIPLAVDSMPACRFATWKRGLLMEIARLTRGLHQKRGFHKDLYLCHFYVPRTSLETTPTNWRGIVHLIDFHRLTRNPFLWRLWQAKDLGQLLHSSDIVGITPRDRLLFWREYLRGAHELGAFWLKRVILFKWRLYQGHSVRQRQRKQSIQLER